MVRDSRTRRLAAIAAMLAAAASATRAAERIGPDDAVRIALDSSPTVRAAVEEGRAAEADRDLAASGRLPRVDLVEDVARSTNPVFVFSAKLRQEIFGPADFDVATLNTPDATTNAATRLEVRQNVWSGNRTRHAIRAADAGIDAAAASLERTRDEVAYAALEAFWNAIVAGEMLGVAGAAERAAEANLDLTSEQVDAGLAVPSDRMAAEVRLAEVRAMRIRAEAEVEVAAAALRRALGTGDDHAFEPVVPDEDAIDTAGGEAPDSLDARIASALAARADLAALDHRIRQAEAAVRIARAGRLPTIGAEAQVETNSDVPFGADGDNWTVGVGLRVPVFDGTATRARVARARADHARLEAVRAALRDGVHLEVRAAWARTISARERLGVAEAALDRAGEALRIVRERYGEGMAVVVELLGAETAHTRAHADHAAARGDLWVARANLDLASGRRPSDPDGSEE